MRSTRHKLMAAIWAVAMIVVACGGGDDDAVATTAAGNGSTIETSEPAPDTTEAESDGEILVTDDATRFFELDWTVTGVERRPDGPSDEGEDTDPTEDFVYVDLEVSSPLEEVTISIPYEWLSLVNADGAGLRPVFGSDPGTDGRITYIEVAPNRTQAANIVYAIDESDDLGGAYFELDQTGYLPAALAGPASVDEGARLSATFDTTTYDGPFSRDEATVEILDAYWSRELGTEDDGVLIASPDNSSRRPPLDHVWLLVHFEVTCRSTGINTGGCNVIGGEVVVDGQGAKGSVVNGLANYDESVDYWAAYPVPVDAGSVSVEISDGRTDGKTNFVVTDLEPLRELTTPEE